MKTEIYVVSHKQARMPEDPMYVPVQVGDADRSFPGFQRDNTGDNIADKNASYCELTAQYWGTYNRQADIKGLVHYRRLFSTGRTYFFSSVNQKWQHVLDNATLTHLMRETDMILPRKRNYYIENMWQHYQKAHHIEGLVVTRQVLQEKYPDYVPFFDQHMQEKKGHMFNMLIARGALFDAYTDWLMDVLTTVEQRVDMSDYNQYEQRIFGFISELLLDVWVNKNHIHYRELPVMFMGNQHWGRKLARFFWRTVKPDYDNRESLADKAQRNK